MLSLPCASGRTSADVALWGREAWEVCEVIVGSLFRICDSDVFDARFSYARSVHLLSLSLLAQPENRVPSPFAPDEAHRFREHGGRGLRVGQPG